MLPIIIITIFVFLLGIVIGSFLNVCILRIPEGETIVTVPSHCMSCGCHLKWYDLVPLFSYIFLRGKCRNCGAHISLQYPLVEAINGIGYVLIYVKCVILSVDVYTDDLFFDIIDSITYVDIIRCALYCLLLSALIVLTLIDWRTYEIPLGINICILILGIIYTVTDVDNLVDHLIGLVAVSVPLLIILLVSRGRAIGGGDVKLMAAAGLLLGWQDIILAFVLGCIIGSVIHIIRMRVSGEGKVLALGPYLSAGIMIDVFFGEYIIGMYMSLLGLA